MISEFFKDLQPDELIEVLSNSRFAYTEKSEQTGTAPPLLIAKELAENYPAIAGLIDHMQRGFDGLESEEDFYRGLLAGAFLVANTLRIAAESHDLDQLFNTE